MDNEVTGQAVAPAGRRDDAAKTSLWQRSSLRVKGLIVLAIPLLPLSAAFAVLLVHARQDAQADGRVTSIRESRDAAAALLQASADVEIGITGYVATKDPVFLEPFERLAADLDELAAAVDAAGVGPGTQELLEDEYAVLLRLRERADSEPARALQPLLLRSKENMDRIRAALSSLLEQRGAQLRAALTGREALHAERDVALWIGALGGVVGGAVGVVLFVREIARRVRLLQQNSRLLDTDAPLAPIGGRDEIAELGWVLEETRAELLRKEALRKHAEAKMMQSRDEADRANKEKSEFLSRMSHELRTPLNSVLGFAQLLTLDELAPEQRDNVDHIIRGGRHLLDLINEVLDIARIESGQMSLSVEPVDVRAVVEETVSLTEPLASDEDIEMRVSFRPAAGMPPVSADQQRLKQIILNLLSNAIKYNVRGGAVDVVVSAADGHVQVDVSDTGPGLSEEQMSRLFTPFNRLGAEESGVEGTGLGLVLSKGLAEAMGGSLSVGSRVAEGTTVTVALLAAAGGAAATADVSEAEPPAGAVRPLRVLYVEDNQANVQLVRGIFRRRPGTKLLTAATGRAGVRMAREARPDVILLDLNLPDIQGDEVLDTLARDRATASIPVVMLSADATGGQIQRLKDKGAAAYVTKPMDVRQLLEVLDEVVERVGR
ncbi:MAG: hybrid sensor histidine kinase/response regulator [Actinomycetota bacterium]